MAEENGELYVLASGGWGRLSEDMELEHTRKFLSLEGSCGVVATGCTDG